MILAAIELCVIPFIVVFVVMQVLLPLLYDAPVCPWFRSRAHSLRDTFSTQHNGGRHHDDNP